MSPRCLALVFSSLVLVASDVAHGAATVLPPVDDVPPPRQPKGLTVTGSNDTSITLAWRASDDVVAGYLLWRDGTRVASTKALSYTYAGLACGTVYTLAVAAYDAAGYVSSRATTVRSTAACPPPSGASVFVATTGSDANACTQSAPCASFARAYRVASCGAVVEVAGGSYPDQVLLRDSSKDGCATGNQVVFREAAGASVTLGLIRLGGGGGSINDIHPQDPGARHVKFVGFAVSKQIAAVDANDVTFENITTQNFYLSGAQDILIKGGDYSHCGSRETTCEQNYIDLGTSTQQQNARITIDGALIHDYQIEDPADHYECLIVFHVNSLTIRNTKFWTCQFYSILFGLGTTGRGISNITIENTWFDAPLDGFNAPVRGNAVAFRSPTREPLTNVLFRFNSFHEATGLNLLEDGGSINGSNIRVIGNLLGNTTCNPGVTYAYNLRHAGTSCGGTERTASSLGYTNPNAGAAFDAHLLASSPALALVTQTGGDYDLATDIDNQARANPRDAGADER